MADTFDHIRNRPRSTPAKSMELVLGRGDVADVAAGRNAPVRRICAASYGSMQAAFDELASRSDAANPFMSPALVAAAATAVPASSIIILAAYDPDEPDRLTGLWCLRQQRDLWSAGLAVLQTPLFPRYECLSAPVLDRVRSKPALMAMLAHVKASADLPNIIRATSWPTRLNHLLPADISTSPAEIWQRAVMRASPAHGAEAYLKASLGKALNKRNNRQKQLAQLGELAVITTRGDDAVAALEHYIRLEAKGWKGQSGTSLSEVPPEAAYMRAAISQMANANRLAVDMLTLDGKPVAVGIVVEAGHDNLYWKAAFDEDFSRFSPGSLLHLAVTRRLFSEHRASLDSGMMAFTSPAYMPWSERAEMAHLTIGNGPVAAIVALMAGLRLAARRLKARFRLA